MAAAGGDNFTDEFAQLSGPANNKCGNVIKFPWHNPGRNAGQISLSCRFRPCVGDTKKKGLVGDFRNSSAQQRPGWKMLGAT
jgi:hypothetical protein